MEMRFKKLKQLFSYQPASRLVAHQVEHRHPTEVVIVRGMFGQSMPVEHLDTTGTYPRGYYFTSPRLAIEAFIARAEAALAAPCDAQNRRAWRASLATARRDLSSQISARRDV